MKVRKVALNAASDNAVAYANAEQSADIRQSCGSSHSNP